MRDLVPGNALRVAPLAWAYAARGASPSCEVVEPASRDQASVLLGGGAATALPPSCGGQRAQLPSIHLRSPPKPSPQSQPFRCPWVPLASFGFHWLKSAIL